MVNSDTGSAPNNQCFFKNFAVAAFFTSRTSVCTNTRGCASCSASAAIALSCTLVIEDIAARAKPGLPFLSSLVKRRAAAQPDSFGFGAFFSESAASFTSFGALAASACKCSPPAVSSALVAMSTTVGMVVIAVRLCPLFVRGATPANAVPLSPPENALLSAKHDRAP